MQIRPDNSYYPSSQSPPSVTMWQSEPKPLGQILDSRGNVCKNVYPHREPFGYTTREGKK